MATVAVAAMGRELGASLGSETAVPLSTDPAEIKNLKVGSIVSIDTAAGLREYLITRWRGLVRVRDIDGQSGN